jgi:hypothetical protein
MDSTKNRGTHLNQDALASKHLHSAHSGSAELTDTSRLFWTSNSAQEVDRVYQVGRITAWLADFYAAISPEVVSLQCRTARHAVKRVEILNPLEGRQGTDLRGGRARARLEALLLLLSCHESNSDWFDQVAGQIGSFTEWSWQETEPSLSEERAIAGLHLLSQLHEVFPRQPFVYPSPNDSLTMELIGKKGRMTIILDAEGIQIIQATASISGSTYHQLETINWDEIRQQVGNFSLL